ncbi:putative reverse transcriptase domain-containing protein [Tanacetum coccineum]
MQVIIVGVGGATDFPGMVATLTPLSVIGVHVRAFVVDGLDSLLSIVQVPRGVLVVMVGINNATNAGLLAVRMLGVVDTSLQARVMSPLKCKFRWAIMRSTGIKNYIDPISGCKIWCTNRKCRIPIDLYPCKVEESMTMKKVGDQTIRVIQRRRIDKEGNVSRFQEYHTSDEEEEELSEHPPYNKYRFVDHPQLQMEDQRNKFAPYPLPPQEGNMNGWLIDDANDSDLDSAASNQPMSSTMEDISGS